MQPAANNNFILTDGSSLKQFADLKALISYGGFYQFIVSSIIRGVCEEQVIRKLGDKLIVLAEHAHALRRMDELEVISQILLGLPLPREYEIAGLYYQALCVQRLGFGDADKARRLLEPVAENATPKYRARAMFSLAANARNQGDNQSALPLYWEAARFVSSAGVGDSYSIVHTQRMIAVVNGEEGNHRSAVALLEKLFPFARSVFSSQPDVYYDYMNSLAVELGEVGRLEEAKNVSRIVLASPFASAYPEWRETSNEIEIKGYHASRSVVGFTRTPKASNIVRLPAPDSLDQRGSIEPAASGSRATVLSMQQWKKKMTKKENDTPESEKDLSQMDGRELLLEIMSITGSKERTDEELLQMLRAINKVLAEPKGKGEK